MPLKAFILAAGEASRFAPYSRLLEKSMLPLGGKPLVRIIAERLYQQFAFPKDDLVICVLEKHEAAFKHEFRDMHVTIRTFDEPMGTTSTFSMTAGMQGLDEDDDILLHYADCYTSINYADMYQKFKAYQKPAMIAISKNVHHDYSEVLFDSGINTVIQMKEKPQLEYPTWTGIAIFNYKAFLELKLEGDNRHDFDDFGYNVFPKWVAKGKLSAYMINEPWFDVGNVAAYTKLAESFGKASER